ncbi:hypothetical protein [Microtetraspora malaysiensis]|uniref:Uncharacterized protein n=1 Tax=Microtetraspora malaysiensis TaxID=161358 RepID=A0ABW6SKH8_9ACTN
MSCTSCCAPVVVTPQIDLPDVTVTSRDVEYLALCDDIGSFLRRLVHDETGALVSAADLALDAATPYTPTGPVHVCTSESAPPPVQSAQLRRQVLRNQTGGPPMMWDFFASAGGTVESVTLTVISGQPSIQTDDGFSALFVGESVTWSALADIGAGSDQLVGPLIIHTVGGDTVAVSWTVRP